MTAPSARDLARDVGQLLWIGFDGTELTDELRDVIARGHAGAVILFKRNLPTSSLLDGSLDVPALVELNRSLHDAAAADAPPLWIAVDQEGGRVQRARAPLPKWPPMLSFDRVGDGAVELAESVGEAIGRELAALGFDIDFAPVLDVHTNPANPVIGDRAFATTADKVAERALAFARGLDRAGLLSCGKHFPGHGDTSTDSHLELPRLDHPRDRLNAVELAPFRRAADAALPMIMTAHVVFAAIDDAPATLSRSVITGLLREQLGYRGLIISDDLDMRAITRHVGPGEAAVRAIQAGCDAVLLCRDQVHQHASFTALCERAAADSALRANIGEAADRIRAAKARHAARADVRAAAQADIDHIIGCDKHHALASTLARSS